MDCGKRFNKKVIDFIASEEGGVDEDKIIRIGGLALALLVGQVGAEYIPSYAHNNYVLHSNFIEYLE